MFVLACFSHRESRSRTLSLWGRASSLPSPPLPNERIRFIYPSDPIEPPSQGRKVGFVYFGCSKGDLAHVSPTVG